MEFSFAPALVAGSAMDLQRLCSFLLRNRLSAARNVPGTVIIRTAGNSEKVVLAIEDTRPTVPASRIASLFDPNTKNLEGTDKLELAACKAITRRLQGRISARAGADGGLIIEVELPAMTAPLEEESDSAHIRLHNNQRPPKTM